MTQTATLMPQEVAEHFEQSSTLSAALDYARRGLSVLPIWPIGTDGKCTCPNPNCGAAGKHPMVPSWTTQGTTDPDIIKGWWGRSPDANIGILTGKNSGFFVLDVDTKDDGLEKLEELEREHGALPATVQAITGSGGKHILFKYPENIRIPNKARFHQGLDVRSDGGMFVAAPSRHASGNRYEWVSGLAPDQVELADCPEWVLRLIIESCASRVKQNKHQKHT